MDLRISSKYSFYRQTIDSIEVSNSSPTLKTVWKRLCFPLLSRWTVCKNYFGAGSLILWPHQTPPTPRFLSHWHPELQVTLPARSCPLPQGSHRPAMICKSLQLDSPFHLCCQPVGPGITTATSTSDLATSASSSTAASTIVAENRAIPDSVLPTTSGMWLCNSACTECTECTVNSFYLIVLL